MDQRLSPSARAATTTEEIVALLRASSKCALNTHTESKIKNIVRSLTRDVLEQCARIAEDYVANEDPDDQLKGQEVSDAIAVEIRQVREERRLERC